MAQGVTDSQQWQDCLKYMSRRVKKQSFETWLKPTKGEPGSNGDFHIAVPNQFVADWIGNHFSDLIDEAFREVLGKKTTPIYILTGGNEDRHQRALELPPARNDILPRRPAVKSTGLDARYRFNSLVVGDFNEFVYAASTAVAEAPGMTNYNPLYIYGGTGLGKTHIIHAIGNRIADVFPNKRIMYATSEKFTSEFIASISDGSTADFTRRYRDVDLLLIDDIQFFTGKESTQEQFFHTFNSLYHSGKQIILTSDRPPKEIKGLEERLLSRISWGLVTDLQAPDLENRMAILQKKVDLEGTKLPEEVVQFIADQVRTNIRELEGALTRLIAFCSMKKTSPNLETARKVLSDLVASRHKEITIDSIIRKTSEQFGVSADLLIAKKKTANIALARQVAMYLARTLTDSTLKAIGTAFGGRDHSTVIHACEIISKRMSAETSFRQRIDKLSASLLY